jgi:hypothetical protein
MNLEPYKEPHLGSFSEEVDDPNLEENEVERLLQDLLGPLDFSGIQGYLNVLESSILGGRCRVSLYQII